MIRCASVCPSSEGSLKSSVFPKLWFSSIAQIHFLHTSNIIPALYPKTHLVQPLHSHCRCFLSHGIIYPSYINAIFRKSNEIGRLFFGASYFGRKMAVLLCVFFCLVDWLVWFFFGIVFDPCALKVGFFLGFWLI